MTTPGRISAFHAALLMAFLLVGLGDCQSQDMTSISATTNQPDEFVDTADNSDNYDKDEFIDNRIDATTTFVSPAEKFTGAISKPFRNIFKYIGIGKAINTRLGFGEALNKVANKFKAIYPGTEWCGAGNISSKPEDVGLFKNTDRCCRAHDHCTNNLGAGETRYGLRNDGIFTRSHCSCDTEFYGCLKDAYSFIATNVGLTYFNILRPQCFKKDYPARCVKYGRTRLMNNKCLTYDYDYTKNKIWQWFDTPDFL